MLKKSFCTAFLVAVGGPLVFVLGPGEAVTGTLSLLPNGGFEESVVLSATESIRTSSCPITRPAGWAGLSAEAHKPCSSETSESFSWESHFEVKRSGIASLHVVPKRTPFALASEPLEIGADLKSVTASIFVKGSGEVSAYLGWMVDSCLLRRDWLSREATEGEALGKDGWTRLATENKTPPEGAEKVRMVLLSRESRSEFTIYYLKNARASNVAVILTKVYSGIGNPRRRPLIVADDRLNAIIVFTPYRSESRKAIDLLRRIDAVNPWDSDPCWDGAEEEVITELSGRGEGLWWDDAEIVGRYP